MASEFITVPARIMRDKNLNQSQKFILAEIEQLATLERGCFATNLHFSNLIGITKENASRNINDLHKKGYISIEIVAGSRNHTRVITVTTLATPPYQNSNPPLSKQQETKENKQINNTKENIQSFKNDKSEAYKVAKYLLNKIKTRNPSFKSPNIKAWTEDIDKAMRIDNRSTKDLIRVIEYIYTDKGSFWVTNVLSGAKLRKQFDKIFMQLPTVEKESVWM